jgi:hypothetical protein
MLRRVYRAQGGLVLPLQATGTSGMEAGLANLVEPGETVIVGSSGYFGTRIAEIARRCGADVVEVSADWGEHVPNGRLLAALDDHPDTRLLAGRPRGDLGPAASIRWSTRRRDARARHPADGGTASPPWAGSRWTSDGWGIDYAYSCTQKCLAAPPGMSPGGGLGSSAGAHPHQAGAGPVLDGPAASQDWWRSAPRPTTTRHPSSTSMRSTRSSGAPSDEGPGALGQAHRGRTYFQQLTSCAGLSCWRNQRTSSRPDRGSGCPTEWMEGCSAAAPRRGHRGGRRPGPTLPRSGGSA